MTKTLSVIKDVIDKKKQKWRLINLLIIIILLQTTNFISDSFNNYYVNIGPDLAKKIPKCDKDPLSYIPNNIRGSIFLKDATYSEISKIIMLLKNSSPGWDGTHTKVVKNT